MNVKIKNLQDMLNAELDMKFDKTMATVGATPGTR